MLSGKFDAVKQNEPIQSWVCAIWFQMAIIHFKWFYSRGELNGLADNFVSDNDKTSLARRMNIKIQIKTKWNFVCTTI